MEQAADERVLCGAAGAEGTRQESTWHEHVTRSLHRVLCLEIPGRFARLAERPQPGEIPEHRLRPDLRKLLCEGHPRWALGRCASSASASGSGRRQCGEGGGGEGGGERKSEAVHGGIACGDVIRVRACQRRGRAVVLAPQRISKLQVRAPSTVPYATSSPPTRRHVSVAAGPAAAGSPC